MNKDTGLKDKLKGKAKEKAEKIKDDLEKKKEELTDK